MLLPCNILRELKRSAVVSTNHEFHENPRSMAELLTSAAARHTLCLYRPASTPAGTSDRHIRPPGKLHYGLQTAAKRFSELREFVAKSAG
jgi:hypothetical protein